MRLPCRLPFTPIAGRPFVVQSSITSGISRATAPPGMCPVPAGDFFAIPRCKSWSQSFLCDPVREWSNCCKQLKRHGGVLNYWVIRTLPLLIVFLVSGCGRPYQKNEGVFYREEDIQSQLLDKDLTRISFSGNAYKSSWNVHRYLEHRCAEFTLEQGFEYFEILDGSMIRWASSRLRIALRLHGWIPQSASKQDSILIKSILILHSSRHSQLRYKRSRQSNRSCLR